MNDPMILIVKLRVEKRVRNLVRDSLIELFERIKNESTFLKATLHEDLEDPEQLLVYEVWWESREFFLAHQVSKPYRTN